MLTNTSVLPAYWDWIASAVTGKSGDTVSPVTITRPTLMPVVFVTPHDSVFDKVVSNVQEVKARGGRVIAITTRDEDALEGKLDYEFRIPETEDMLTPVLASVPLQLLAYYIAVKRGANVDQPRNLAKSVTVE